MIAQLLTLLLDLARHFGVFEKYAFVGGSSVSMPSDLQQKVVESLVSVFQLFQDITAWLVQLRQKKFAIAHSIARLEGFNLKLKEIEIKFKNTQIESFIATRAQLANLTDRVVRDEKTKSVVNMHNAEYFCL